MNTMHKLTDSAYRCDYDWFCDNTWEGLYMMSIVTFDYIIYTNDIQLSLEISRSEMYSMTEGLNI